MVVTARGSRQSQHLDVQQAHTSENSPGAILMGCDRALIDV